MNMLSMVLSTLCLCLSSFVSYGMEIKQVVTSQNIANKRLLHAATVGNIVEIKKLLNNADLNTKNMNQCTPLYLASFNNHTQAACMLILAGADVNIQTVYQERPLVCAIKNQNIGLVNALIKSQAQVNISDEMGTGILTLAIQQALMNADAIAIISALLNAGSTQKEEALLDIMKNIYYKSYNCTYDKKERKRRNDNYFKVIELLIKVGVNINISNQDKSTPLMCAIEQNNFNVAQLYVQYGADVNSKDIRNNTAFTYAHNNKNIIILDLLVKAKAEISLYDEETLQALKLMINSGYFSTAIAVLNPNPKGSDSKKIEMLLMMHNRSCCMLSELPKDVLKVIITFAYPEYAMDVSILINLPASQLVESISVEDLAVLINRNLICRDTIVNAWQSKIEQVMISLTRYIGCARNRFKEKALQEIKQLLGC
jgi:ankyrin repeat protein